MAPGAPAVSLPNLPGFSVRKPAPVDARFPRPQTLKYVAGYAVDENPVLVGQLSQPDYSDTAAFDVQPASTSPTSGKSVANAAGKVLPSWVVNDRKVLRWYGYFLEGVADSPLENFRVRKITLHYYLENDTIEVTEPKQDNSGIPQGAFIKRHQLNKADRIPLRFQEISVGTELDLYGKLVRITDADSATRHFMQQRSLPQGPAESYPTGPYDQLVADRARPAGPSPGLDGERPLRLSEMLLGTGRIANQQQFMTNSRKVLRFYCIWDDRQRLFGDRQPFRLHYFLEDDTVEILEVPQNNSGRDAFPVFLRRTPLPKDPNNTRPSPKINRSLCYGPGDFRLGTFITVYGRAFYLHDCDGFTRQWYQDNAGYTKEQLAAIDVSEPAKELPVAAMPPWNGFGSLEDSAQSCLHLIPKQPVKDFYKLMQKDKIVLRFSASFAETASHKLAPSDRDRRFVLSYFMADDTISIFEPPVKNTGIVGGRYLERGTVHRPDSLKAYTEQDLYAGARIIVHARTFELLEADEFTMQFMENNRHVFPQADWNAGFNTLKGKAGELRTALIQADASGRGYLTESQICSAVQQAGAALPKQLVITMCRKIPRNSSNEISAATFLSALQ